MDSGKVSEWKPSLETHIGNLFREKRKRLSNISELLKTFTLAQLGKGEFSEHAQMINQGAPIDKILNSETIQRLTKEITGSDSPKKIMEMMNEASCASTVIQMLDAMLTPKKGMNYESGRKVTPEESKKVDKDADRAQRATIDLLLPLLKEFAPLVKPMINREYV